MRENKWLINDANLTFYIDRDQLNAANATQEPNRLYLYNMVTNEPILDYYYDPTPANATAPQKKQTCAWRDHREKRRWQRNQV